MISPAQIKATTKYEHKSYDKITFRIRKDGKNGITREDVQAAADASGMSLNEFVLEAVKEKIEGSPGDEIERVPIYD